ncbi:MAG: tRNA (adenosine(37)-N6)-threonylcarbamoyltransferase complex dimerization subunit type 1 TsaB [Actinoallomurus sp.]
MLVLAFDTATAAVTVALSEWAPGESPRLRAEAKIVDRRRHAEVLAPAINTVLGEARVSRSELSAIAVGVGPGPYTGLRVGLVTARSLGAVLEIPVHGVCTLDALAWESRRTEPFVVATDARRKEVYWARYDSAAVRVDGPSVGKPADAAVPGLPVLGEGATLYADILKGEAPELPSAGAMAELVVARLSGGAGPELLPPEPLYLRQPDAREPGPRKRVTPR